MCKNEYKIKTFKILFDLTDEEVKTILAQKTIFDKIREESEKRGEKIGELNSKKKFINNMISKNYTIEQISQILSISIEEINATLES